LPSKKKSGPVPGYAPAQPLAVQVRGTPEWKQWVEDLAEANRQQVSGLVDTALARLAKEIGFRDPPKR
jgi:hypothetical protein